MDKSKSQNYIKSIENKFIINNKIKKLFKKNINMKIKIKNIEFQKNKTQRKFIIKNPLENYISIFKKKQNFEKTKKIINSETRFKKNNLPYMIQNKIKINSNSKINYKIQKIKNKLINSNKNDFNITFGLI